MEKYQEVIEHTLELLSTIEEGVLYAQKQALELNYEGALTILQDAMEGINCIENAIEPMKDELAANNIDTTLMTLKDKLSALIEHNGRKQPTDLENQVSKVILPCYISWKTEVEKTLKTYIVS